jgi:hypothetical protein
MRNQSGLTKNEMLIVPAKQLYLSLSTGEFDEDMRLMLPAFLVQWLNNARRMPNELPGNGRLSLERSR